MDVNQAWRMAQEYAKKNHIKLRKNVLDDGKFYVFDYAEELDVSPIGINKTTGEIIEYFPLDLYPELENAKRVL